MAGEIRFAGLDWEANAPRSVFFDDIYFSGEGAAEARHVFLGGNDLAERFATARRFTIGEIGFGTGLNVLAAADLWRRTQKPDGARLHFLSFEKHPLAPADLARAHSAWPQFADLGAAIAAAYPPPVEGLHQLRLAGDITLTLVLGDALSMIGRIEAGIDAWFLDGFAPAKNPELWSGDLFRHVARLSAKGASAATFTVAGSVRRSLAEAGFAVEKRAGYGRKREMLAARIDAPPRASLRAPWFDSENVKSLPAGADIAIIGGGVAGASLAFHLRRSGHHATIIDEGGLAAGASGNPAGLVMPRLDLGGAGAARFFLAAYLHALSAIRELEAAHGERIFNPCGVLLKAMSEEDRARQQKILDARLLPQGWIEEREEGLFFPQAGVADPPRYCALLAMGAGMIRDRAASIAPEGEGVIVRLAQQGARRFDAVILANGRDALRFREARSLPLSGVMGQVDLFANGAPPPHAIAFGPYAAPAPKGGLVIGATYEKIAAEARAKESLDATRENIRAIAEALPVLASDLDAASSFPRASIRCQTPDRVPVAGPVPDWSHYGAAYDDLRLGRKRDYPPGRATPRVYILAGLGSRGLVTAPLAAAAIAAEIAGAPSPIEREMAEALHPARFFIRDLKRSQRIVAN